jgi:TRAP transporter TAXI family solute receptor
MFARALTALAVAISATTALAEETIRLQASAPGSTMFIVGTHLATVLKEQHGYTVEVATGFPGVRSMVNTANYETELSIYAPAMSYFLQNGIAMYKDTPNHAELAAKLRPLFTYEGDLFTLGTYDPDIATLADLEDKRVFLGPQGAALVTINAALIEAATGLKAGEDYELVHVDWPGSPALLQDGTVDVLFQLCAVGCSTWAELASARPVHFLGYSDEQIATEGFQKELAFPGRRIKTIMPGDFGPGQGNTEPVQVIGEFTGILANDQMSDEVAYNITRAFWETKDDLARVAPFAESFSIEDATFGMIDRIHPGAARYLAEQGVALPAGQ